MHVCEYIPAGNGKLLRLTLLKVKGLADAFPDLPKFVTAAGQEKTCWIGS